MDLHKETMEDLFGKPYDIEKALEKRGFRCDFDGDHRTSYLKGNLSVTIHWDGDILTPEGVPNGFSIWKLSQKDKKYIGPRPKNDKELDELIEKD